VLIARSDRLLPLPPPPVTTPGTEPLRRRRRRRRRRVEGSPSAPARSPTIPSPSMAPRSDGEGEERPPATGESGITPKEVVVGPSATVVGSFPSAIPKDLSHNALSCSNMRERDTQGRRGGSPVMIAFLSRSLVLCHEIAAQRSMYSLRNEYPRSLSLSLSLRARRVCASCLARSRRALKIERKRETETELLSYNCSDDEP